MALLVEAPDGKDRHAGIGDGIKEIAVRAQEHPAVMFSGVEAL